MKECEQAVEVGRESRADFKLIAKVFIKQSFSFGRFLNVLMHDDGSSVSSATIQIRMDPD